MSSGGKYFVTLWGGLGDFVKMYYGHAQWRKLESLKANHPDAKIKAIVYSLNPNAKGLAEYHPCIDEVFQPEGDLVEVRTKGLGAYRGDYKWLQEDPILKTLKDSVPRIYLSPEDKELVEKTVAETKGKLIVVHPFSAMNPAHLTSRTAMPAEEYIPIIEGLGEKGFKSVILGSNKEWDHENFSYESEHTINLIGKTSVRSALSLVSRSQGFIGTNSCFMCEAMAEKKPSFVVTSYFWKDRAYKNGFIANGLKNTRSKFTFLPQDRTTSNYKKIQQEAIGWFN